MLRQLRLSVGSHELCRCGCRGWCSIAVLFHEIKEICNKQGDTRIIVLDLKADWPALIELIGITRPQNKVIQGGIRFKSKFPEYILSYCLPCWESYLGAPPTLPPWTPPLQYRHQSLEPLDPPLPLLHVPAFGTPVANWLQPV